MIEYFHSKQIKVIVWTTSMVDVDSPNYNEGLSNGFYVRDLIGKPGTIKWWHGHGSLVDYSNPKAVEWWHKQMDLVLNLGIDGWKCDGTDPYILELPYSHGYGGFLTHRDYANAYYGDFFNYTRLKRGNDTLIMSRPVDGYKFLYLEFSPHSVMFSGWVGDQDPTFDGLEAALKRYLQSAWDGYANFGSDIGGYRTGQGTLGRSRTLFLRWMQLGAFSPLMENGGNKEHRPWMFEPSNETTAIYKKYVSAHLMLMPYLLATGSKAYETRSSSITPLAKHDTFIHKLIDDFKPTTYNYLLGSDILVCPVINDPAIVDVTFPTGSWVDFWNSSNVYKGGDNHTFTPDLATLPVFYRAGAIIPLRIRDNLNSFGDETFQGSLTFYVNRPKINIQHSVEVRDQESGMIASYWLNSRSTYILFEVTAHRSEMVIIVLQHVLHPTRITSRSVGNPNKPADLRELSSLQSLQLVGHGFFWNSKIERLVIRPDISLIGISLTIHF
ncbi:alpha-glucosidase 2-like [Corticium candelabrum]|uniref:alpha-glucosidase 2-like n=1 Tax=Corticium candelabrum TaxID=121492 RepID=UPI002E356F9B|nr:alpha-glucosidase 2-like [Corticium candelabrum]XP_062507839.1 alpha-glucosidase 2-like [Corticium candelabrum]